MIKYSQEILRRLAMLRPIDDIFMYRMFKDNVPLTELLLQRIIGVKSLTVQNVDVQYNLDLRAVGSRSLRLDILAQDADGTKYNVEVQRDDRGASPQRARYHIAAIDVCSLKPDADFNLMPQVFMIFITEHDVYRRGEPIYRFERSDAKTGDPFNDGSHIIYVNGQYRANDLIGDLMHDFLCSNPAEMRVPLMAERAAFLKTSEKGVNDMCQIMEDYVNSRVNTYGRNVAISMLKKGKLSYEEISEYTSLPIDEILSLAKNTLLS